jgi:AbrB family looped-hinge helix DNA binding protein
MATSTLTSKGQITLPRAVRDQLGLAQGDRVEFTVESGGRVLLRPATERKGPRVVGLLNHLQRRRPLGSEQIRSALRRRARTKYRRSGS